MSDFHDEYEVEKMIGKGSFGRVYYAKRIKTGKYYAIKAISKKSLYREETGIVRILGFIFRKASIMRSKSCGH